MGKKKDTICIVILALTALILLLRNCYSFCWSDESLYVENVYRLYQGDVIILDEWNMTMISAYIWLPVFSLWHLLFGNVGVYLFFRCLYTLISLCIAIYVFISLKEYNREGVLIGCITYMIYSRANIMGCSYYNTGLSFWLLAVTVLWDISMNRKMYWKYILLPIATTCAVLSNPYLVIPSLAILVTYILIKKDKKVFISLVTLIVLGLLLYNAVIGDAGLSLVLKEYAEQNQLATLHDGFFESVYNYFIEIVTGVKYTFIPGTCLFVCSIFFRKARSTLILQVELFISTVLFLADAYVFRERLGLIYLAVFFFMVRLLPLVWDDIKYGLRQMMIYYFLMSFVLSFIYRMASNNHLDAIGIGLPVSMLGCFPVLFNFLSNNILKKRYEKTINMIILMVIIIITIGNTLFLRIFAVYRDDELKKLTKKIDVGPAYGLYTTEEHYLQYKNIVDDVNEYINSSEKVLIGKIAPWAYLCTDARCEAPTTWRLQLDDKSLQMYYKNHDLPDKVIVLSSEYGGFIDNYISTWGENGDLHPNENVRDSWFLNELKVAGYERVEIKSGVMYMKR